MDEEKKLNNIYILKLKMLFPNWSVNKQLSRWWGLGGDWNPPTLSFSRTRLCHRSHVTCEPQKVSKCNNMFSLASTSILMFIIYCLPSTVSLIICIYHILPYICYLIIITYTRYFILVT